MEKTGCDRMLFVKPAHIKHEAFRYLLVVYNERPINQRRIENPRSQNRTVLGTGCNLLLWRLKNDKQDRVTICRLVGLFLYQCFHAFQHQSILDGGIAS